MSGPSISFCITAKAPPGRLRALLEMVRPFVDEIVLAVDEAAGPKPLEACADLADRALRYPYRPPPARLIGWIHHQCRGDWILRLDADEVPSPSLLESLTDLLNDTRLTHALVPRRWLYPTSDRYIADQPWTPDYQNRLVRNVPGIWRFEGIVHQGTEVLGEHRYLEDPIYHLDCLLTSVEQRRRKRDLFEKLRPGHENEGFPVNRMYVPEELPHLETAEVPSQDRQAIQRLLAAEQRPEAAVVSGRAPETAIVTAAEIERFNVHREIDAASQRARIELSRPRPRLPAATVCRLEGRITNLGTEPWPSHVQGAPPIYAAYRWLDSQRQVVVPDGLRTPFPEVVKPEATTLVLMRVETPPTPGRYLLQIDVVHEGKRWFGEPAELWVEVQEGHPALASSP